MYWVVMTHLSTHMQDLPFHVQVSQFFVFFGAQYCLSVLIACIFVDAGRDQLQWLHWKFHVT